MSWLLLNGLDGVTLGYQRDHQVIDPHQPQPPLGHDLSANELTRSRGTPPRPGRPQGAFSSWPPLLRELPPRAWLTGRTARSFSSVASAADGEESGRHARRVRETSLDRVGRR